VLDLDQESPQHAVKRQRVEQAARVGKGLDVNIVEKLINSQVNVGHVHGGQHNESVHARTRVSLRCRTACRQGNDMQSIASFVSVDMRLSARNGVFPAAWPTNRRPYRHDMHPHGNGQAFQKFCRGMHECEGCSGEWRECALYQERALLVDGMRMASGKDYQTVDEFLKLLELNACRNALDFLHKVL
jgi:hypothetical protein